MVVLEEILPLTTSLQQCYSFSQYNDNLIHDTNITPPDSTNAESYYNSIDDRDNDLFDARIDDGDVGHLDNTYDDGDVVYDNSLVNDREDLPHF